MIKCQVICSTANSYRNADIRQKTSASLTCPTMINFPFTVHSLTTLDMYLGALTQAGFLNVCGGECMNGGTCKSNGVCRCRNGFIGTFCDNTCPGGTYGRNCQETCQCSSTAKCLPDTGLCMCLGYDAS